jgi:hypothetical protein
MNKKYVEIQFPDFERAAFNKQDAALPLFG